MRPFDELAPNYDELLRDPARDRFASGSRFFIEQKCRIVAKRLDALRRRRRTHRPLRVLDAGCGQGAAFQFLAQDARVVGCDVSWPMLRAAAVHGRVVLQEPYRLPFADDAFDAVYVFCVYHHIPADRHADHLRELRRVVAPGGEVMVFEHNPYNPITARIFRRAPIDRGCEMISPPGLKAAFRDAGFDHLSSGFLLFAPERLHRALPFVESSLAWLPLGGQYFVAGRK